MATLYFSKKTHIAARGRSAGAEVTDPIRKRPQQLTRKQLRELQRKAYRFTKKQAKVEARRPESEKIDDRLHAAGLVSPRDVAAVAPVRLYPKLLGV